jgi:hypothetical protein
VTIMAGLSNATTPGDRIFPTTRALAAFIVPFLLLGVYALYVRTDRTRQLWAWEIRSPMSALMLASAYASGAYYFARATFESRWHHISRGLLPILAFATLMGAVTVVHWPLFIHGNIAFRLWAGLYFITPALVAAVWWHNRRDDPGAPEDDDVVIPLTTRRVVGGIGLTGLVTAAVLLFAPGLLIRTWAWPLTVLTARVLCVTFILLSIYLVSLSLDSRWSAARLNIASLLVGLLFVAVGILRTLDTFLWSRPTAWLFTIGTAAALLGCAWSLARFGVGDRGAARSTADLHET